MLQNLRLAEYDIAGNVLRAWYDDDDRLVFVVDETIDEYKPNVLLVVRSDGKRRWDDLLQNVYNVDLEVVRPRRDNKYQKLDIEYSGIDVYEELIHAYETHGDVNAALADLIDFRDAAVRRAATVRLTAAQDEIAQATSTADKAEHAIKCLNDRMRNLRNRLARQKSYIGREPTKQSASRILRVEAQIESTEEKLSRAEKRIENARRRAEIATGEVNAALALLALRRPSVDMDAMAEHHVIDAKAKNNSDVAKMPVTDDVDVDVEDAEPKEPEDSDMPNKSEEVKPLLDKDPEILDDEIAFKPVDFGNMQSSRSSELKRPLSPYAATRDEPKPESVHDDGDRNDAAFGFPGEDNSDDDDDGSDDDALPRTDIDDYDDTDAKVDDRDDDTDDAPEDIDEDEEEVKAVEIDDGKKDEYKYDYKYDEELEKPRDEPRQEPEQIHEEETEREVRVEPEHDYSVEKQDEEHRESTVDDEESAKSEFEDNFGHGDFGTYSYSEPEYTEKKFDDIRDESQKEPVIDTIKSVDESVPADVDTTGDVSTAQYDNRGIVAPQRPFSPVEVPKMQEETRPMSPIQNNERPRPVGGKRSGFAYYILLILLIALSIFTLWLYQKKNGGTVPFLGMGEKVEVVETDEPDVPVDLTEPDEPIDWTVPTPVEPDEPVWVEPTPEPQPTPVDKPIEVRYPNDDILRGPEPEVRVIESEEDVLARKYPYGVSRDDKPVLVEVTEPVIQVTTVISPDVIIEEDVVSVPMPIEGEDFDRVIEYDNPANVEYVTENYIYEQPQYIPEPQYVPTPQPEYVPEPEPVDESRRDFSVHDGGQYSVTETVTYRAN